MTRPLLAATAALTLSLSPLLPHYRAIHNAANRYGVPVGLAYAVGMVESSMRSNVSLGSCHGLFQVNLPVWRAYFFPPITKTRLLDPTVNADIGCWIIKHYYDKTGSWDKALFMFNNGYRGRHGKFNHKYVNKVKKLWKGD